MGCLCATISFTICLAVLAGIVWIFTTGSSGWSIEVNVESAALTRFDLGGNGTTLRYNLTLGVSVRNANRATVYYNKIAAAALYGGELFGAVDVPTFTQGKKTTTMIYPNFNGEKASMPPAAGGSIVARYGKEKGEGLYGIDLRLYTDIKIEWTSSDEFGTYAHSRGYTPVVSCALRVPPADGAAGRPAAFSTTACSVKF